MLVRLAAGGRQTLHSERFCGRSIGRIKPIVPDAASVMSGGFAQKAEFAKFGSCAKAAIRQRCS